MCLLVWKRGLCFPTGTDVHTYSGAYSKKVVAASCSSHMLSFLTPIPEGPLSFFLTCGRSRRPRLRALAHSCARGHGPPPSGLRRRLLVPISPSVYGRSFGVFFLARGRGGEACRFHTLGGHEIEAITMFSSAELFRTTE